MRTGFSSLISVASSPGQGDLVAQWVEQEQLTLVLTAAAQAELHHE